MNRWLLIGSMLGVMALSTGCLHHNTRGGCSSCANVSSDCGSCSTGECGSCNTGTCSTGDCGSCNNGRCGGLLSKARGRIAGCHTGCGRTGCQAGPLGWQQGGLDYSSQLNPGCLGHQAGAAVASQPFQAGAPSAQVAYPYYTHRGPRDFLMANPPSIGP